MLQKYPVFIGDFVQKAAESGTESKKQNRVLVAESVFPG